MKPILKESTNSVEPNKDSKVFGKVKKMLKRTLLASIIATATAASLVSCSQEIVEPQPVPIVTPDPEQEEVTRENRYELTITNLEESQRFSISNYLPSALKNSIEAFSYNDEGGQTKYSVKIYGINDDDELLSIISKINFSNARYELLTNAHKISTTTRLTKDEAEYLLNNLYIKNGNITIKQKKDSTEGYLYYTATINQLDLDDFNFVKQLFDTLNKKVSDGSQRLYLSESALEKDEFLNSFLSQEPLTTANFYVEGGTYYSFDKLFNITNPNIWYYNGSSWIQPGQESEVGL